MLLRALGAIVLMLAVSGCAMMKKDSVTGDMQTRVNELEQQLDEKDAQMAELKDQVEILSDELKSRSSSGSSASDPSMKGEIVTTSFEGAIRVNATAQQAQLALQRAGFYSGPIDGKIGERTKKAIADFQKSRNLRPDGVIGKKTWAELRLYLE